MPVHIVIADDHALVRAGLRMLVASESDFRVIGEAGDGVTALRLVEELRPDVLLADVGMPPPTGIELAETLSSQQATARVLIVTAHEDHAVAAEAKRVGAAGFLTKRALESELIRAISAVAAGGYYWQLGDGDGHLPTHENHAPPEVLDDADRQLLLLIVHGCTLGQVAQALGRSAETAEEMRQALTSKLGLHNRASLTRFAQDQGLM